MSPEESKLPTAVLQLSTKKRSEGERDDRLKEGGRGGKGQKGEQRREQ